MDPLNEEDRALNDYTVISLGDPTTSQGFLFLMETPDADDLMTSSLSSLEAWNLSFVIEENGGSLDLTAFTPSPAFEALVEGQGYRVIKGEEMLRLLSPFGVL